MGSKMFGQYAAISALFLGAAVANAAVQATFYVAPDGSDSNKGTKEAPFKTITQAQKAVRAINGTMTGDIEVILRDGTYQLPATVNFTEADGGKDGNYGFVYTSCPSCLSCPLWIAACVCAELTNGLSYQR